MAVKDGGSVRKKATSRDKTIYKMDKGESIEIVAGYRSDNGNLWFENTNGNIFIMKIWHWIWKLY